MFATLAKWLVGGGVGQIITALQRAHEAKLKAQNDADRLAADLTIESLNAQLEIAKNAKEIRSATSGFWEMRLITFIIAACFSGHLLAVTLDTIFKLGWGIPAYPKPFDEWQGAILLSFFGIYTVASGVRAIATGLIMRGRK